MNKLLSSILALVIAALTGCATYQNATPEQKAARVASKVRFAAYVGTVEYLKKNPDSKQYFIAAKEQLNALLAGDSVTPDSFNAIMKLLPIDKLGNDRAYILVGLARVAFEDLEAGSLNLDSNVWLVPIVSAVSAGIAQGIGE